MARATRTRRKTAEPAPEPEVQSSDGYAVVDREPTWLHEAFAEWLEEATGVKVKPKHIQLVTALRNEFRKSELYLDAKEEAASATEAAEEPETPAPTRRRGRQSQAATRAPARRTRRTRAAAKAEAEPAEAEEAAEAEEEVEAEKPAPRRRTSRRTTKAQGETPEAPF
jgi:hypothetical protein